MQRKCKVFYNFERHVCFASLDLTYIRAVKPCRLSEGFLAEALIAAKRRYSLRGSFN